MIILYFSTITSTRAFARTGFAGVQTYLWIARSSPAMTREEPAIYANLGCLGLTQASKVGGIFVSKGLSLLCVPPKAGTKLGHAAVRHELR